jgi:hypothetical protein
MSGCEDGGDSFAFRMIFFFSCLRFRYLAYLTEIVDRNLEHIPITLRFSHCTTR